MIIMIINLLIILSHVLMHDSIKFISVKISFCYIFACQLRYATYILQWKSLLERCVISLFNSAYQFKGISRREGKSICSINLAQHARIHIYNGCCILCVHNYEATCGERLILHPKLAKRVQREKGLFVSQRLLNSRNRSWFIYGGRSREVNFKFAVYSWVLPPLLAQSNQLFAGKLRELSFELFSRAYITYRIILHTRVNKYYSIL